MKENETGIRMEDDEFLDHIWAVYRDEMRLQSGMKEKMLPIFRGKCEQKYQLMPGVTETLQVLQAQNVTLGVVSNHRANIRSVLNRLGFTGFFFDNCDF